MGQFGKRNVFSAVDTDKTGTSFVTYYHECWCDAWSWGSHLRAIVQDKENQKDTISDDNELSKKAAA